MDISKISKFSFPDKGFPKRVLKTSIILSVIFIIYSFYFNSLEITLSLTIGLVISVSTIHILWRVLNSVFVPGDVHTMKKKAKRSVAFAGICKYFLVGVFLFFVFRYLKINLIALFIGISVVQIVIVFKISGILLVNYLKKSNKISPNNLPRVFTKLD